MSGVTYPYRYLYEAIPAGATAQTLGGTGAIGDYLHRLIVTVNTPATGTVTLIDNATSYPIVPVTSAAGVFFIDVEAASQSGAWKITTGAGATVIAVGIFSA